jgi:predicted MPP superfamily phosphohydrolase
MSKPERRNPSERPLAPRPSRRSALPGPTWVHHLCTWFTRWLRPRALGRWLARRLEHAIEFSEIPIAIGRLGPGFDGLRVALISDLHAGLVLRTAEVARIFDRLADLSPDLVLLAGDLIDSRPEDVLDLGEGLSKLSPRHGVFAVPGNHDRGVEPELRAWREALEAHGVRVLMNCGVRIEDGGDALWLAGVDDLGLGKPDLERALRGCDADEPVLLMTHQPDLFVEAAYTGVDLTVAGHTHGGQIAFAGVAPWMRKHSSLGWFRGHYRVGAAQLYVGRGAGVTFLPIRIGARPEIPIFTLHGA